MNAKIYVSCKDASKYVVLREDGRKIAGIKDMCERIKKIWEEQK